MEADDDGLCSPEDIGAVIEILRTDDQRGLASIDTLLLKWPLDPRLHFLKGSVLAGLQRYGEGRAAMARAVEIAPDFTLARFQLGFLDLTSGRAVDAIGVWRPLGALPDDEPLRLLAEGLANLAADNFSEARRLLRKGIGLNAEHPLINADMQLILDEIEDLEDRLAPPPSDAETEMRLSPEESAPATAVDMLLRQSKIRGAGSSTKH